MQESQKQPTKHYRQIIKNYKQLSMRCKQPAKICKNNLHHYRNCKKVMQHYNNNLMNNNKSYTRKTFRSIISLELSKACKIMIPSVSDNLMLLLKLIKKH